MVVVICQVDLLTDQGQVQTVVQIALTQTCIDDRSLVARVRSNEDHKVSLIQAGNARVESKVRTNVHAMDRGPIAHRLIRYEVF